MHVLLFYNSPLPMVFKSYSKAQKSPDLGTISQIDELDMMNGSKVYLSFDCTSFYHHTALLPEGQKQLAFVIPIYKFKFKKVPFVLAEVPAYFQYLVTEALKC